MRKMIFALISLLFVEMHAALLYPGQTTNITFEPTTGEHNPVWTTDNPTIHLSSVGFLCNATAQAYFGGTATVTCTYKDQIGSSISTRTRRWTFTCADTKISISPSSKTLKVNESFQLSWGFGNAIYITPSIQFTGYDTNILSVSSSGRVTAKNAGSTKIYVKSNLGTNSEVCSVNVTSNPSSEPSEIIPEYDSWDSSNTKTIVIKEPGTLASLITASQKYQITNLSIIGPLNGYDLRLLRDMCGLNEENEKTNGKLAIVDLKDAVFVTGGPWYMPGVFIPDTPIMPVELFARMVNLKKIRFPKYITELSNFSLLHCQSLEYIAIPPGVVRLDHHTLNAGNGYMPLQSISLPSSLTEFKASIYNCRNLTDFYCYAQTPPIITNIDAFSSGSNISKGTLYVPKGCAKAYWNSKGWNAFYDIKETLELVNTLSVNVGAHGAVKYNDCIIKQTYNVPFSGRQAFEVPQDKSASIVLIPEDGYEISSIHIDGIPQDIPSGESLLIGKISKATSVSVEFAESATLPRLNNDMDSSNITVYTFQGVILKRDIDKDGLKNLPSGLYIIQTGTKTQKYLKK
ncbi:MAG: leucine-rich repeat protein [[Clostridium] fimetarium]|nr:leucine-rich repeat protein [Alistipes timonensis]MCM1405977.1 leucine-rich repeat protein [[Clostridium] fimetarium]